MLASPCIAAPAVHPVHRTFPTVGKLPAQAPATFAKLAPRLTPAGRAWVGQMSATIRSGKLQPDGVRALASQTCETMLTGCNGAADIDALIAIVLAQSTQDTADDLKDMLADMESINRQKEHLRAFHEKLDKAALDAEIDAIRNKLDSKSELGETESLRLQMAMDRLSKLMSALSNILKKISDTNASIVRNVK